MSKAEKMREKKDKAKSFNGGGTKGKEGKNAKRWNWEYLAAALVVLHRDYLYVTCWGLVMIVPRNQNASIGDLASGYDPPPWSCKAWTNQGLD